MFVQHTTHFHKTWLGINRLSSLTVDLLGILDFWREVWKWPAKVTGLCSCTDASYRLSYPKGETVHNMSSAISLQFPIFLLEVYGICSSLFYISAGMLSSPGSLLFSRHWLTSDMPIVEGCQFNLDTNFPQSSLSTSGVTGK